MVTNTSRQGSFSKNHENPSRQRNFAKDNGLNNIALIIGINEYNKSKGKFKSLKNAVSDAIDLAKILDKKYDYNVHLFSESKQWKPSSGNHVQEPTLNEISTFLREKLPAIVNTNKNRGLKTCLLFYFAGHGEAEQSDNKPKGYLIPGDAEDHVDTEDNKPTWLEMTQIYEDLSSSGCHHVMMILDCCYSGAFLWATEGRKAKVVRGEFYKQHLQRFREQSTQLLMYSAAYNQEASDGNRGANKESGNSPFAAALINVLKKNISTDKKEGFSSKGIITASQLFSEIQNSLSEAVQQPGIYPLKREFVGREYIFYSPQFDEFVLGDAPAINKENNPYRGLQAFEERHADLFHGRDALKQELYDRLHLPVTTDPKKLESIETESDASIRSVPPLTIVLGNSGSGKSSLVKAGLLPRLRNKINSEDEKNSVNWRILDPIRPDSDPFISLARTFLLIDKPELFNDLRLNDFDQYFNELLNIQQNKQRNKRSNTEERAEIKEEEIQLAHSWKTATSEARLLMIMDYPEEEKRQQVVAPHNKFKEAFKKLAKRLNKFFKRSAEQSNEDSRQVVTPEQQSLLAQKERMTAFQHEVKNALEDLAKRLRENSINGELDELTKLVKRAQPDQSQGDMKLLLVIDQLEELLTMAGSDKTGAKVNGEEGKETTEAVRFLGVIRSALESQSEQFRVVMTLRSDFEPRFLDLPLEDWWQYSRFPVRPMSSDELRQAIEEPAQANALEFKDPQLVGQLIDELGQPGALPLLSFLLSEIYLDLAEDRKGDEKKRALELKNYNHPGEIAGFLSRRADDEYNNLAKEFGEEGEYYQAMMQQVMLRMVTIDGGSVVKRRVPESELVYPTATENRYREEVVRRLVEARLLVKGRDKGNPYYEPAHDYLIYGWARLQDWIEKKQEDFTLQQRLTPAANDWQNDWQERQLTSTAEDRQEQKAPLAIQNRQSFTSITVWSGVKHKGLHLIGLPVYGIKQLLFWGTDRLEFFKRRTIIKLQRKQESTNRNSKRRVSYLWHADPRVDQLSFLLDNPSWLNKLESDFVRHSVVQKHKRRAFWNSVFFLAMLAIGGAGIAAIAGHRKALIEQTRTALTSASANFQIGQDLEAIESVVSAKLAFDQGIVLDLPWIPELKIPNFAQLSAEPPNLREALFQSVYSTKERNILSLNRGNIYQVATTPADIPRNISIRMATVEEGDSVRLLDKSGQQLFQLSACSPESAEEPEKRGCELVYSAALGVYGEGNEKQLQLATGGNGGVIYLWNITSDGTIEGGGEKLQVPKLEESTGETTDKIIWELDYNATGTKLAFIQDNKVWLWQSKDENNSLSWKDTKPEELIFPEEVNSDEMDVWSIAFHPDSEQQLAVGLSDGQIQIWDVSSPQEPAKIVEAEDGAEIDTEIDIYSLAFSQNGEKLAVGGQGSAVKLFDVNEDGTINPDLPDIFDIQQPVTYNFAFLDNNQLLTVGVSDGVTRHELNTLRSGSHTPITAQQVEEREVKSIAYSPDGQLIATAGDDNSIRLWDRQGQQLARSYKRSYDVQSLAFSPDGKTLVSSGSTSVDGQGNPVGEGMIEAWGISSQQPDLHNDPIGIYGDQLLDSQSFSASRKVEFINDREILSLGVDRQVTFLQYDASTGSLDAIDEKEAYAHLAESQSFAFSPTTTQRAIIDSNGILIILGQEQDRFDEIDTKSDYAYTSVAFSPDGTKLAVGAEDGWVQILQIPLTVEGKIAPEKTPSVAFEFQTHQQTVNTLAFSPDDPNALTTGGENGEVKFWDLSQDIPDSSRLTLRGIQTVTFSSSIPISAPQSSTSLGQSNSAFRWLSGGELLQSVWEKGSFLPGGLDASATSNFVQRLVIISQDKQLELWELKPDGSAKLSEIHLTSEIKAELVQAKQLILSPDGNLLVAIADNDIARAWNLELGKPIDWRRQNENGVIETALDTNALDAEFSPDGKVLMTLNKDNKLQLWNVTNSSTRLVRIQPSEAQSLDAKATESSENQPVDPFNDKTIDALHQVAIDPKDEELMILSDGLIEIWNLNSWNEKPNFKLSQLDSQILFSPNSKLLATIGQSESREVIRLWDYDSRNLAATLKLPKLTTFETDQEAAAQPDEVKVAFSPNGHLISATNSKGVLSLWDTEGNLIFKFPEAIKSASFTADGSHLAVVQPNGELTLWSVDPDHLLAKACEMMRDFETNNTSLINTQDCPEVSPEGETFSTGEKLLISSVINLYKLAGINRLRQNKQNNFSDAVRFLEDALKLQPNDPESRIYLNNAKILDQPVYKKENIHTIAVPVPIDTNINAAQEILRGVAQAQEEINNNGGINGQLLRVVIANDSDDKQIARQVAQRLVDDPEVEGVVGHYASDTTIAANEIYREVGLVSISPVSTAVDLFGMDGNPSPYAFRTVPNDQKAAKRLADYMVQEQNKIKAVVFYNTNSTYSKSLTQEFERSLEDKDGEVVDKIDLSKADFNAVQEIQKLKEQYENEDTTIVLFPNAGILDRAIQIIQANDGQFLMLGGDDVYSPTVLKDAREAAKGLVIAVPWHINRNCNADFVEESRRLWHADVNWRTATAYDAVMALEEGLRRRQEQTREGLAEALAADNFIAVGATDNVSFEVDPEDLNQTGNRDQNSDLVEVKQGSRANTGFDFEPVAPQEDCFPEN